MLMKTQCFSYTIILAHWDWVHSFRSNGIEVLEPESLHVNHTYPHSSSYLIVFAIFSSRPVKTKTAHSIFFGPAGELSV